MENYLTVKEVADLLKLSELTIYKYIREQKLEAFEFGRHFRIPRSALEDFIRSHKIVRNFPSNSTSTKIRQNSVEITVPDSIQDKPFGGSQDKKGDNDHE